MDQIEPRLSKTAAKSDKWIAISPGTEGALALGLANVIIKEKLYHHIVSPKTGRSPLQSASVTVMASNVMDADALSTAVFVLEPVAGKQFIENMPKTECLILSARKEKIASTGWPSA